MPKTIRIKAERKRTVPVQTETITLGSFLKLAGVADTGGMAGAMIAGGGVEVNGEACAQRGRKLAKGDRVRAFGKNHYVG